MAWTNNQQKVIDSRDSNILVSAAAGSGKTAVLVERIIKRITDKDNPIDIDRILVVTFTNAAAKEMRERILKAVENELEKNPESEHLQRQHAYIHNANITTMHSFCLKIVKENFNKLDLDASVRVADTGEIELLKSDVIKEVIEEYYERYYNDGEKGFIEFVEQFEDKKSDSILEEMITDLYNKAMGYPWPDMWFEKCMDIYAVKSVEEFENSNNIKSLKNYTDAVVNGWMEKYKIMLDICRKNGFNAFEKVLSEEYAAIQDISKAVTFDNRKVKFNYSFATMRGGDEEKNNPEEKERIQIMRNGIRDEFKKLKEKIFFQTMEEAYVEVKKCEESIRAYIDITKSFMERFKERKKEKNILDFNDFEHYAINLLTEFKDGEIRFTELADELASEFEEVMMDEYQDANLVQETILSAMSKNRQGINNRFMVGDVKQSIYGFRGSDPSIFVDKYNKYLADEENHQGYKIILDKNFRSRQGVITTTNFIFSQIMKKELGGIEYDEDNMLYLGAEYPICEDGITDEKSELVIIDTSMEEKGDTEKNLTTKEAEAHYIAARIKEMVSESSKIMVFDKNNKKYRKVQYSDIVILLRAVGSTGELLNEELTREGIPCHMEQKTGYFKSFEIKNVINMLKIIDNPLQDIPLAAVLKSIFAGLNDEEIAKIRVAGGKNNNLYNNICKYIEYGCDNKKDKDFSEEDYDFDILEYDEQLYKKLVKFMDLLNEFRVKLTFTSIYDIICDLFEKTEYYNYVKAMPAGKQRQANLDMLKEKAAEYEKGSYKGLFNFIRYIEKMDKYEIDMGEASVLSESDNVVRIMTIHKSKGLEFPIVFMAYMGKQFNTKDTNKKYVIDFDYGIGMDYVDVKTRLKSKNLLKASIIFMMRQKFLEEEIRVFYVACTRAREKLIFTTSGINKKKILSMASSRCNPNIYHGYADIVNYGSMFDMMAQSVGRNPVFDKVYSEFSDNPIEAVQEIKDLESNIEVKYVTLNDTVREAVVEKVNINSNKDNLKNMRTDYVYLENEHKRLSEVFKYEYPYSKETESNAKMSVSEIKKISYEVNENTELTENILGEEFIKSLDEINETEHIVPEFIEKKSVIKGAARGTAYHTVFELFDFDMEANDTNIKKLLETIHESGRLSDEEMASINVNDIKEFANSDLGKRMKNAYLNGKLFREAQFVMGISESEVEEFKRIAKEVGENKVYKVPDLTNKEGDIILIQGIIDAYFIEDGKVVIADYKTDRINKMEQLKEHYYVQLELYGQAVNQITGMNVSEKILYSVQKGKSISW